MKLYIKDGKVKTANRIVIIKDDLQIINPTEEMILEDGWVEYVAPEPVVSNARNEYDIMKDIIKEQYNSRTDISDSEALDRAIFVYNWSTYIGKSLKTGQVVSYGENLYRVRQDINPVIENHFPSLDTAALYEVIEIMPTGEIDDPIPYTPPMEIFSGKYYTQDDVLYLCNRDSEVAISHNLSDLIGLYVEIIE